MRKITVRILESYKKWISPLLVLLVGRGCKYELTCSQFAIEAVEKHGVIRGGELAIKRFLSCNPYSRKSFTQVPERI